MLKKTDVYDDFSDCTQNIDGENDDTKLVPKNLHLLIPSEVLVISLKVLIIWTLLAPILCLKKWTIFYTQPI